MEHWYFWPLVAAAFVATALFGTIMQSLENARNAKLAPESKVMVQRLVQTVDVHTCDSELAIALHKDRVWEDCPAVLLVNLNLHREAFPDETYRVVILPASPR